MARMREERIEIDKIPAAIAEALEQMDTDVRDAVTKAGKDAAEYGKKLLKAQSPVGRGRGGRHYKDGWAVKRNPATLPTLPDTYTIFNRDKPGLTHLLEHGHQLKIKGKAVGDVGPVPHIAIVREAVQERFIQSLENIEL